MPEQPVSSERGLQAERTLLSWERSAFGFLTGGALLLLKHHGPFGPVRTALAVTAALLVLLMLGLGNRRSRGIRGSPSTAGRLVVLPPRTEVLLIGGATVAFATLLLIALMYSLVAAA